MKLYVPFLIAMATTVVEGANNNNEEDTHHRRTRIRRTTSASTVVIDDVSTTSSAGTPKSSDFGEIQEEELERILTTDMSMSMSMDMSMASSSSSSSSSSPESPLCVGDHCPKCDGICAGEYPYGCAWWFMDDKTTYQCQPNGGTGCAYLAEGEEPMEGWCTYWEHHGPPAVEDECDNVCKGEYPYGCAWWDMDDVVNYQCQPVPSGSGNGFVGGCAYLEEGESGHAGWCTYKTA
mmetsp:Transcript_28303/g.43396  ORF Transcript_28303/g.43396 Transcript_28303/m.43396 type:complete len:235 (+) Transcript_28303:145-849(+)